MVLGDGLDQRGGVAYGRGYFMAAITQYLDDPRPDHGRVFGDHYSQGRFRAHGLTGNSTATTVGPLTGLETLS